MQVELVGTWIGNFLAADAGLAWQALRLSCRAGDDRPTCGSCRRFQAPTRNEPLLTLYAMVSETKDQQSTADPIKTMLLETFGIDHSSVQIERGSCPDDGHG